MLFRCLGDLHDFHTTKYQLGDSAYTVQFPGNQSGSHRSKTCFRLRWRPPCARLYKINEIHSGLLHSFQSWSQNLAHRRRTFSPCIQAKPKQETSRRGYRSSAGRRRQRINSGAVWNWLIGPCSNSLQVPWTITPHHHRLYQQVCGGLYTEEVNPGVPQQKLWNLLKTRCEAFRSRDPLKYKESKYDLHRAIKTAKDQCQSKLETQADTRRQWQGLNDITGSKKRQCKIADDDISLPDRLNTYARFEQNFGGVVTPILTSPDKPIPTVTAPEVRSVFLCVNPRKAMGPDGVSGCALRACAGQLAEIFSDIFNLSLQQATVPACFARANIIPVAKKAHAACLNDYCPVARTLVLMKWSWH
ncbi:uncharacterized protein [Chiloscyllium punctatum]|uniref:uncharacterized protein n=1 Tax=Chiloscyllium punctatum TaxID=137246 RepID=UPI003B63B90A